MIYCVIPPELADELYDKMVKYYKDATDDAAREQRKIRDRRRARVTGTFPETDPPPE